MLCFYRLKQDFTVVFARECKRSVVPLFDGDLTLRMSISNCEILLDGVHSVSGHGDKNPINI